MICENSDVPATEEPLYIVLPQLLHRYFSYCFVRLEELSIHPGQFPLLLTLRGHGGCTQAQLSRYLHIKAPTVTVMLDKLERIGLVERRQDPADKRKLRIYLTQSGAAVTERAHAIVREISTSLMTGIGDNEITVFRNVINRMKRNLDTAYAEDPRVARANRGHRERSDAHRPLDF